VIPASRLRALALFAAAGACAAVVGVGCSTDTTTTPYTPITGILLQSQPLVAGFGCGTGPTQVYRYAAVVNFASVPNDAEAGALVAGPVVEQSGVPMTNIFDCFNDGVFENLPSSDAGGSTYLITIFAYNQESYVKAGLPPDLTCPPLPDAGLCTPGSTALSTAQEAEASWTTVCHATQQGGAPVFAVCPPLESVTAPSEGRSDASADAAPEDAAPEARSDAAADATLDAPAGSLDGATDASAAPPDGATDAGAAPDVDAAPLDGAATSNDG
jgi:hypothetical protein